MYTRVIPCLLIQNRALVKTVRFNNPVYIGDPLNAVKILNEKEVDELVFLDISASVNQTPIDFNLITDIASECFMPFAYGGGIRCVDDVKRLINLGIEKVILNSSAVENIGFVEEVAHRIGSQSLVVSIDAKRKLLGGYEVCTRGGRKKTGIDPLVFAAQAEAAGAGELFLTSIDRDGTMAGYDLKLLTDVTRAVSIPVIASGGAGSLQHFREAIQNGASAVSAGSMFVFHGPHKAVLISYLDPDEIKSLGEFNCHC
ncbi:MAG TPA: AglZ/HisF2 family acetamidino modification protein [Candidatus Omnitrophota bacterium]|nr:AglZ/HisF2 family acetamidino modification protein [Candidatus Omnitrophota bacterium]